MTKGRKYNEIEAKDNMDVGGEVESGSTETVEKEKLKPIIEKPKKVKRSLMGRLAHGVLGPEGVSGIGQYVAEDIIVPAIKNIIYNAIETSARMAILGEKDGTPPGSYRGRHSAGPTRHAYQPSTNYGASYGSPTRPSAPVSDKVARPSSVRYGVEEYRIEDRFDAAQVLTSLTEHADMYETVSVADYYDLIGAPSQYTDENYGWTIDSITRATIVPVRGGYIIRFPAVEVI